MSPRHPAVDHALEAVIADAQRLGMLGGRSPAEMIEHSRQFVAALADVTGDVVDVGSGGGLPGLVIAHDRPDLSVTLIDRRQRRTDFLAVAVRRLEMADRVSVRCEDLDDSIERLGGRFTAVTARSAGPPQRVLRWAAALLSAQGVIVISDPPDPETDRWPAPLLGQYGLTRTQRGGLSLFHVKHREVRER
jgi:16S rRNA (guanine527-N7)-methyltransferase